MTSPISFNSNTSSSLLGMLPSYQEAMANWNKQSALVGPYKQIQPGTLPKEVGGVKKTTGAEKIVAPQGNDMQAFGAYAHNLANRKFEYGKNYADGTGYSSRGQLGRPDAMVGKYLDLKQA